MVNKQYYKKYRAFIRDMVASLVNIIIHSNKNYEGGINSNLKYPGWPTEFQEMGLKREFELHPKILLQHFHVTLTATLPSDMINNKKQFSRRLGVLHGLLRLWKETRNTDSAAS